MPEELAKAVQHIFNSLQETSRHFVLAVLPVNVTEGENITYISSMDLRTALKLLKSGIELSERQPITPITFDNDYN